MKFRDPETGEFKELYTKAADTLPVGTEVDFDGTEVPTGWEEIYDENEKAFAQMHTNKSIKIQDTNVQEQDVWGNNTYDISSGKFYCDAINRRLVIPPNSAKTVEISGLFAGSGYILVSLELWDEEKVVRNYRTLSADGTNYKAISISSFIVNIPDISKTHYVIVKFAGYGDRDFYLNDGFEPRNTYINVKKIK